MNIIFSKRWLVLTRPSLGNMIINKPHLSNDALYGGNGHFSGRGKGIVTVDGTPARREIWLISLRDRRIVRSQWSKPDGTYYFGKLDPNQEFMLIARDYERERAPFAWDYRKPKVS